MDNENYISPNKITKQYDITSGTLRRWAEAGKIRCLRPNGGKRIYNIEDIKKIFNKTNNVDKIDDVKKKEDVQDNQEANRDIQNVLGKLKQNIQEEKNIDSINNIASELSDIITLIDHIKKSRV